MIDHTTSEMLARCWEDGNNAYDLEMIMEPFAKNVVFSSPFVTRLTGDPAKTTIEGYNALREYIAESLSRVPGIRYSLDNTFVGTDSIVLVYTCHLSDGRTAVGADSMRVDGAGKVIEWRCHYALSPAEADRLLAG
jgi:hypothetical protein